MTASEATRIYRLELAPAFGGMSEMRILLVFLAVVFSQSGCSSAGSMASSKDLGKANYAQSSAEFMQINAAFDKIKIGMNISQVDELLNSKKAALGTPARSNNGGLNFMTYTYGWNKGFIEVRCESNGGDTWSWTVVDACIWEQDKQTARHLPKHVGA